MDNSIIFKMVISLEIKDMENEINRYSFCLSKKQIFFKRIKTNLEKGQGTKKHRNRPLLGCLNRQNPCTCMLSIQKNIEEHIHETDDGEFPGGDFHCHGLDQSLVRKQILQVVQHGQKEKKKKKETMIVDTKTKQLHLQREEKKQ